MEWMVIGNVLVMDLAVVSTDNETSKIIHLVVNIFCQKEFSEHSWKIQFIRLLL